MSAAPAASADALIRAYLDEVAAGLHGPRRRRARILAELNDGLNQAVAEYSAAGLTTERAAGAAITQFGTPAAVAAAFADELAVAYARHSLAWFLATGPLVGIWWLLLLHPRPWPGNPAALVAAIPVVPLVVAAVATAVATLATTGRLTPWLHEANPRTAVTAVQAVAALAVIGDVAVIALYSRSGLPMQPAATIAITASVARIAVSTLAIRHAARQRGRTPAHPLPRC